MEQKRADKSSATNQGKVVAALLDAKKRGKVKGLYGRLGMWEWVREWWKCGGGC